MSEIPPPPPPPPMSPPPGYQPYGGFDQQPRPLGKATAAMVCGIIGIIICPIVLSVLALVFGIQSKGEIDRNPGAYTNRGQAQAGVVLGIIGLALMPFLVIAYSRR